MLRMISMIRKSRDAANTAFDKQLDEAAINIRKAAQNITYGKAEEDPVDTVLKALPKYMELAGRARLLHEQENTVSFSVGIKRPTISFHDLFDAGGRHAHQS